MITLYNEKNEKIKLISTFEFNDADMGESSISATVSFDKEQDFHPDWYVVYNGEKFRLGVRKPTGKKDTSSLQTSYTLVFKSEREDLKRYTFMDFVELGGGNPQPSSYNVSLYTTLSEFVDRFNTNLRYYMGSRWKMVLPDGYVEDGNAVSVAFENASLWDVLLRVYEAFGVRWVIRSAGNVLQIQVGFQEVEIEHIFEYGKGNGLVSVERNNALERIITRLRGRGSEKNLPPDYFHAGDPDTNSFLQATFFKNLMPKSYRDYIRGYNAGSGTGSWAYNQGVVDRVSGRNISPVDYAISDKEDLWGVSYGAIEPNEQVFPTLQGATRNGVRLDEVLSVEQVLVDGVREPQNTITVGIGPDGQKSSSGKCGDGSKNNYLEDCRDGIKFTIFTDRFQVTNPINASQVRITLVPSYINSEGLPVPVEFGSASTVRSSAELQLVDFTGSATGKVIRTQTISDADSYLWELDNIPAGDYCFRTNVAWSADIQSEGYGSTSGDVVVNVDTRLTEATVKEYARASAKSEFKETFDIEIRDVWGVTRNAGESDEDYTYRVWAPRAVSEDMAVMFSDGLLAGEDYEFRIVGFNSDADNLRQTITSAIKPTNNGGWKLTLQKSDAELDAGNIYLPNTMQNAKAGDHFFFVNIAMPYDPYVYDAEERLLSYLDEQLAMKDEEYPSFTITPSKIFCSSFTEADKIQAGAKIRVRNTALVGESYISLYIQSLTKRYSATSLNPEWNLTISDQVVVSGNPVETLQGEVNVLAQRVYGNRSAMQEAVRSLSSTFLRKDGIADTSYSPIEFKKPVRLGEGISDRDFINGDISGKGFGVYTDGEGNRVIEADILVGRVGARFNEVVINQATYSAGKQVFSSAGMVVSRVEDAGTSWRCYFDTKNATVRNYFVVNDGAFCQRFVDSGIRQYWARVTSVGPDYIDISKTDRMEGSFNPIVGDNIAQLGNSADRSRQAALIIDETREGGGLVTWYDDITNFTLYDKNSVNIGRIAETIEVEGVSNTVYKTWLQVYGSAFIGNRDKSQFVEFDNNTLKLKGRLEIGSTISDAMTVVEDGLIQSTLLKLGYYKDDIFKVMSGTNGLYDENVLGGGIAAWYGGPMADKEADSSLIEYAQSLFRFDGSGYLAGGNITWDKDGAGSVAGGDIKWDKDGAITLGVGIKISGDANETLGSILNLVNKIASWFGEDEDTGAIYVRKKGEEARDFYTYGAISFGGLGESSGSTGGGGITTFDVFVGDNGPYSLQDGKVKLPAYPVVPTKLPNPYTLTINGEPYDGSAPVDIEIKAGVDDAQLSKYARKEWVEENFTPVDAHNTLSQRVTALENNGTGGGSGGTTSVVSYNASVLSGKLLGTLTINGVDNKIYAPTIPTKLSDFTNDEGYATKDWVNDQGFLTSHQSLTHLLSKTEAAETYQPKGSYVTENALNGKGYLTQSKAEDTYQPKGNYAVLADLSSYLLISTAKNTYATIQALNGATTRIDALETTLSTEQEYIDTLQGYFTSGKANKAIADGNGNNIVDTYATKGTTLAHYGINDAYTKTQVDDKLINYLTTNTAQTILASGAKIFKGAYGEDIYIGGTKSGITLDVNVVSGGFARAISFINSASAISGYVLFGVRGTSASGFQKAYIGIGEQDYSNAILNIYTDRIDVLGAASFSGLTTHSVGLKIGTTNVSEKTQNNTKYIEIDGNLVVTGAISFGGFGEGGSTGGGITSVTKDMVIKALDYTPYNDTNPKGYITASAIPTSLKNPAALSWSGYSNGSYDGSSAKSITIPTTLPASDVYAWAKKSSLAASDVPNLDWSKITTGKPTTLNGYGIKDAITTSGGTITGSYGALIIKRDGTNSSLVKFTNTDGTLGMLGFLNTNEPVAFLGSDTSSGKVLLHAGNYTDYALAKDSEEYVRFSSRIYEGNYKHIGYGYDAQLGHTGPTMSFGASSSYYAQILATSGVLYFRQYYLDHWYNDGWKQLAFTTSNVASATKLKTSRTIWGKSFDGTQNVEGDLSIKWSKIYWNTDINNYYIGWNSSEYAFDFVNYYGHRFHSGGSERMRITTDGNVGIGTEEPSYKLDVRGAIHTSERLNVYKWIKDADNKDVGQGGIYVLVDSYNEGRIGFISASQTAALRNEDFSIINYTGGNITIGRIDQWDTPLSIFRIMKDSAVVVSSSDKKVRHLVAGVEDYFEKGYFEVAGMNFAITSKETNIADITGVTFDWKKDIDTLELSRVYYDETSESENKILKNDFNLKINGNLVTTGSITFGSASDRRLKDNIKSMTDEQALAVLSALNPVTFSWNSTAYELGKLSGVSDGFIADEYEKLIPNSGRDIWANYRAINYERATGYLVKGWQNHETRLEKAERRIKELENELKQYRRN